jgi:zinc resistance-associated protein
MAWIERVTHCLTLFTPHHTILCFICGYFCPRSVFDHASIPDSAALPIKNINIKNRVIGSICHIVSAFGTILAFKKDKTERIFGKTIILKGDMNMRRNVKEIMVIVVLAVFGLTAFAFAGWGGGPGHMMDRGWRAGNESYGNLTADEIAALNQQRAEFFKATEGIRQQLYEKNLALQGELAKDNPDTEKASGLQNDISKLRGELDQTRLDYEIQARKSGTGSNRGFWGNGRGMGSGFWGGGYCRQ